MQRPHLSSGSLLTALVAQGTSVLIALAVAFGLELTAPQIAALMGVASFVGVLATIVLWARTVPREQVLEHLVGEAAVVAGEANDIVPTGTLVRAVDPRRALEEPA